MRRIMILLALAGVILAGCATEAERNNLICVEGHDVIVDGKGSGDGDHPRFVCTKYAPNSEEDSRG